MDNTTGKRKRAEKASDEEAEADVQEQEMATKRGCARFLLLRVRKNFYQSEK
jgi:hypothetical protein